MTGAAIPAGMKTWGPDHPDYPNPPRDQAKLGLPVRRSGASAVGLDWRHHAPTDTRYPHDIVAYWPALADQPSPPAGEGELAGLVKRLTDRLAMATPGPWMVQDGCSWRRIGTHMHDGDVLCPTNHPRDNHPDLIAADGRLYANLMLIVELVNALPTLLAALRPAPSPVREIADRLCAGRDGSQPGPMAAYRQGVRDLAAALAQDGEAL